MLGIRGGVQNTDLANCGRTPFILAISDNRDLRIVRLIEEEANALGKNVFQHAAQKKILYIE